MLIGNNELRLNEATVMAALEEYFNGRLLAGESQIKVNAVTETNENMSKWFRVRVTPEKGAK